jgi:hypothetical protein
MLSNKQIAMFEFVKSNPNSSINQISAGTGISRLAVWRFVTDFDLKKPRNIFIRQKQATKSMGKNGKINGGHFDTFSVSPHFQMSQLIKPVAKIVKSAPKKTIKRDPITAAWFGSVA